MTASCRFGALGALVLALALALASTACLAPPPAPVTRYYEPVMADTTAAAAPASAETAPRLRLAPVGGAAYLRERVVWRRGVELGFHEYRRWTESPSTYVGRALARKLFESGRAVRSTALDTPELFVDLMRCEEVLGEEPRAIVAVRVQLVDADRNARFERTFTSSRALPSGAGDALPRAIGSAIDDVTDRLVDAVLALDATAP